MSHRTLTTAGILGAAPMLCFILAFAGARTSPSVDEILLIVGLISVALGFAAAGIWTRSELLAAAVPAACLLSAFVGYYLPYELGIWGKSIEEQFRGHDTFNSWLDTGYLLGFSLVAVVLFTGAAWLGIGARLATNLIRRAIGQVTNHA